MLSNSRGPESLAPFAAELGKGARAVTSEEAAQVGDLVVVTVPLRAYAQIPAVALAGKVVIDTMNYYPERDDRISELDSGELTSSALVQRHLTNSQVIKAFNNIDFLRLFTSARPTGAPDRSALPVAGDDPVAKAQAVELLDALGYDVVDIGALADSWRSEPGTPVYVEPYTATRPEGLDEKEMGRWFFETPGVPVSADEVKRLTGTAVRRPAGDACATLARD